MQVATLIAVYANWEFARIKGIGWGWAGVIWLYSILFYIPLDIFKFAIRYALSGKAWDNLLENRVKKHIIQNSFPTLFVQILITYPNSFVIVIRLLSQERRIMVVVKGRHNGHWLNAHSTASSHQTPQISSMTRITTESCLNLLNRPKDAPKLPG